jgi:hypothetical protein
MNLAVSLFMPYTKSKLNILEKQKRSSLELVEETCFNFWIGLRAKIMGEIQSKTSDTLQEI